jgi:DNA sulfur modification protein DndD
VSPRRLRLPRGVLTAEQKSAEGISWRYKDIRGGLSGVNVKLGNPPSRWTMIQMPNGMGKTTTMHLFRAAFSGEQLDAEIVRGFRPSDSTKVGEFELVISVVDQIFRILLSLNYDTGVIGYPGCDNFT